MLESGTSDGQFAFFSLRVGKKKELAFILVGDSVISPFMKTMENFWVELLLSFLNNDSE